MRTAVVFGFLLAALSACTVTPSEHSLGIWVSEGVTVDDDGGLVVPKQDILGWLPEDGVLPLGGLSVIQIDEESVLGFDPETGSAGFDEGAAVERVAEAVAVVTHTRRARTSNAECVLTFGTHCSDSYTYDVRSLFVAVRPTAATTDGPLRFRVRNEAGDVLGEALFEVGELGAVVFSPDKDELTLDMAARNTPFEARAVSGAGERMFLPVTLSATVDGRVSETEARCLFGSCTLSPITRCPGTHDVRFRFAVQEPGLPAVVATRDIQVTAEAAYVQAWGSDTDCDGQ